MSESKKGGFGAALKGLFVEEVPDERPAPAPAHASQGSLPVDPTPTRIQPPADPEVLATLEARLQKECPHAYGSFMEQYENMKEFIPDEATRFKAALKASHTAPADLLSAIGDLTKVMDTAHGEFLHTVDEQRKARVGTAQAALNALDQEIKACTDKLQSLKVKYEADAKAVQADSAKIDAVAASFESAYTQVCGRLAAQNTRFTRWAGG